MERRCGSTTESRWKQQVVYEDQGLGDGIQKMREAEVKSGGEVSWRPSKERKQRIEGRDKSSSGSKWHEKRHKSRSEVSQLEQPFTCSGEALVKRQQMTNNIRIKRKRVKDKKQTVVLHARAVFHALRSSSRPGSRTANGVRRPSTGGRKEGHEVVV
eukprot:764299-Hanusia_phi.AAC.4